MRLTSVINLFLGLILLAAGPITAYAETAWLSDQLWVNVRSGPSNSNRILQTITSGTRMEILEQPEAGDFYRVRTEDGLEGWIPSRYLIDEPTGRLQVVNLTAEINQLQSLYEELDQKYKDLLADKGDVNGELESLRSSNEELTLELNRITAISENAINLDAQYQELAEQSAQIRNEMEALQAENRTLREYNDNQTLLFGGALIIIGIILGVILPRMSRRKRDGWA